MGVGVFFKKSAGEVRSSISLCVYTFSSHRAELQLAWRARLAAEKGPLPVEERNPLLGHALGSEEWRDYFGVVVDPVDLPHEL